MILVGDRSGVGLAHLPLIVRHGSLLSVATKDAPRWRGCRGGWVGLSTCRVQRALPPIVPVTATARGCADLGRENEREVMEKEELLRLAYINLTKALKKKPRPRLVRASSARSGPTDAICSRASCCCRWIDSVCIMRLPNRTYCPDDLGPCGIDPCVG
jgi:hypothetical protein